MFCTNHETMECFLKQRCHHHIIEREKKPLFLSVLRLHLAANSVGTAPVYTTPRLQHAGLHVSRARAHVRASMRAPARRHCIVGNDPSASTHLAPQAKIPRPHSPPRGCQASVPTFTHTRFQHPPTTHPPASARRSSTYTLCRVPSRASLPSRRPNIPRPNSRRAPLSGGARARCRADHLAREARGEDVGDAQAVALPRRPFGDVACAGHLLDVCMIASLVPLFDVRGCRYRATAPIQSLHVNDVRCVQPCLFRFIFFRRCSLFTSPPARAREGKRRRDAGDRAGNRTRRGPGLQGRVGLGRADMDMHCFE